MQPTRCRGVASDESRCTVIQKRHICSDIDYMYDIQISSLLFLDKNVQFFCKDIYDFLTNLRFFGLRRIILQKFLSKQIFELVSPCSASSEKIDLPIQMHSKGSKNHLFSLFVTRVNTNKATMVSQVK